MKPTGFIAALTISLVMLVLPVTAHAEVGPNVKPKVTSPIVGLSRDIDFLTIYTTYNLQVGHPGEIVYTIKRHRLNRPGFKTVGTITRDVLTGNSTDQFHVNFNRIGGVWYGFGYRVKPVLIDLQSGAEDTAHAGKLHI